MLNPISGRVRHIYEIPVGVKDENPCLPAQSTIVDWRVALTSVGGVGKGVFGENPAPVSIVRLALLGCQLIHKGI